MRYIKYQIEDARTWLDIGSAEEGASTSAMLTELRNLKNRYPDRRVRCVDPDGRLLDMM